MLIGQSGPNSGNLTGILLKSASSAFSLLPKKRNKAEKKRHQDAAFPPSITKTFFLFFPFFSLFLTFFFSLSSLVFFSLACVYVVRVLSIITNHGNVVHCLRTPFYSVSTM